MGANFPPVTAFDWLALAYVVGGSIGCVALVIYLIWAVTR